MSQASPTIGANKSGLAYRQEDNDGKKAILNHHKGSTAPSYAEAGMIWLDDAATPWLLKFYDGADWIIMAAVNATNNWYQAYFGGSAPLALNYAADTGAANAYAVAPTPPISAYVTGQRVYLKPANALTGAATLAVNGLSTKAIKLANGSDPSSSAMLTGGIYCLIYDGTNFVLTNPTTSSTLLLARGTTLASASTVDLGAADSDYVEISGTTTITSLGTTTTRSHIWVKFQAALTLTHNATSLILPTGANITTAAGDTAEFVRITAGNWQCVGYQRANGQSLVSTSGALGADLANSCLLFDDFHYNGFPTNIWTTTTSGTGAAINVGDGSGGSQPSGRGLFSLTTGSTSTGAATFYKSSTAANAVLLSASAGATTLQWRASVPVVSTSGQRFTTRIGFSDTSGFASEPNNGIYFRQVDNVNSGNLQCVCRNASTETVINTAQAISTSYNLYQIVINAAGTSVEFFFGTTSLGTITTNIPNAVGITQAAGLVKSVGSTPSVLIADYVSMATTRT